MSTCRLRALLLAVGFRARHPGGCCCCKRSNQRPEGASGRRIPWRTSPLEWNRDRGITWTVQAMPAAEWLLKRWPGIATIIAARSPGPDAGSPTDETRYAGRRLRAGIAAVFRDVRDCLLIENSWCWGPDAPLSDETHRHWQHSVVLAHDIRGSLQPLGWQAAAESRRWVDVNEALDRALVD